MKKLTLITLLVALCSNALLAQTNFRDLDWNGAFKQAAKEKKYVFVDCFTTWCVWCKVMDKQTFPANKVGKFANAHFIPIKIDMEKGMGINLALKYGITGYPTYLIFNQKSELVYKIVGFEDSVEFLGSLTASIKPDSQLHLKGYSSSLDVPFPDFYLTAMKTHKYPADSEVVNYLNKQTNLFTEANWAVLNRFGIRNEKYMQFLIDNRAKYRELFGKDEVNEILARSVQSDLDSAISKKDEGLLNKYFAKLNSYELGGGKLSEIGTRMYFYKGTDNYPKLMATMQEFISVTGKDDDTRLNDYCWNIYQACDDSAVIHQAAAIMEKVAAKGYSYMDTYAGLLFKDKQYAKADEEATAAISQGKKEGEHTISTERLLGYIQAAEGKNIIYHKRSDCDFSIELDARYYPVSPNIDTIQFSDGSSMKDSAIQRNGLEYTAVKAGKTLKDLCLSDVLLFSGKKVATLGRLEGNVTIRYGNSSPSYEGKITHGRFSSEAQKKILELKKGDTITVKDLYLADGSTVLPTKIKIRVNN